MRILLVKPPPHLQTVLGLQRFQRLEPLEFGYLAAAIPAEHEVRVLDLHNRKTTFQVKQCGDFETILRW